MKRLVLLFTLALTHTLYAQDLETQGTINFINVGKVKTLYSTNTALGISSLSDSLAGAHNTVAGYFAGRGIRAIDSGYFGGVGNTVMGSMAYQRLSNGGDYNIILGYRAAENARYLYSCVLLGIRTALNADSCFYNTSLGTDALQALIRANNNTAISAKALLHLTYGYDNTAIGTSAMYDLTTGSENTAIGMQALQTTNSTRSTAVGKFSLQKNTGIGNTAMGFRSAQNNTTGTSNLAVGFDALWTNTLGSNHTAIGHSALKFTSGSANTALGNNSGLNIQSGSFNTTLGYGAGQSLRYGSGNVIFGTYDGAEIADSSNIIIIGNGEGTGWQAVKATFKNGNMGVGLGAATFATEKLEVKGNLKLDTEGNHIIIKGGTNATIGRGTLVDGSTYIYTSAVNEHSRFQITPVGSGTYNGNIRVAVIDNGVGFSVTAGASDNVSFDWIIYEEN